MFFEKGFAKKLLAFHVRPGYNTNRKGLPFSDDGCPLKIVGETADLMKGGFCTTCACLKPRQVFR
jgi:hypothetical protein